LAKEIKRRTKVVAAFCKEDTVEKLLYLLGEVGGRRLQGFAEIQIGNRHVAITH
jgi:transposase-like protein